MSGAAGATVIAERPVPGDPRPYHFPAVDRQQLANGLTVIAVDLPGRELVTASLVLPSGAADERDGEGGLTTLMARALSEGTQRHDAIALVEASERLGASLHAEAGWDALSVGVDVPVARLGPALDLVAEVMAEPTFPPAEVQRLRKGSSRRSTHRARRTAGRPAGFARPSSGSMPPRPRTSTSGASTPRR